MPPKIVRRAEPHVLHVIVRVPVEHLRLDKENPRLAALEEGTSQRDLAKLLWNEMAVDELALSIAANGYFEEEPLIVIPESPGRKNPDTDTFVVVEGNRRLAAVLVLRDRSLREELEVSDIPQVTPEKLRALETLPVSIYDTREELWEYFGFRHINGPQAWDAFSKAQFVAKVRENYGISLSEIARRIGDRHDFVKRIYLGYLLVKQAQSKCGFSTDDVNKGRFNFSHLYTAAAQPEFRKFLGLTDADSAKHNPVPKSHLEQLQELMIWLYGSKSAGKLPVVRTQNPDLNTLRVVISQKASLAALRAGYSLQRADEIGIGEARRLQEALTRAKEELLVANGTVTTGYSGQEDLYSTIKEISLLVDNIKREMENLKPTRKSKVNA
ncbi:MAG: hypothetical protein WB780_12740 [Candidatus Acidiferrales bacterium]